MSKEENERKEAIDEKEDEAEEAYNEIDTYRECLKLLRPGESVARAIRRLAGGKKPTTQRKWQQKKQKDNLTEEQKKDRELMTKLSGYADMILSRSGNMEIYEETYEKIAYQIKLHDDKYKPAQASIPEGTNDDDALDMFANDLDKDNKVVSKPEDTSNKNGSSTSAIGIDDDVKWEFKWRDASDGGDVVHGPHSSEEMLAWQESGYFDKGVLVRKLGSSGEFLDGKRIDFDLYT